MPLQLGTESPIGRTQPDTWQRGSIKRSQLVTGKNIKRAHFPTDESNQQLLSLSVKYTFCKIYHYIDCYVYENY